MTTDLARVSEARRQELTQLAGGEREAGSRVLGPAIADLFMLG